MNATLQVLLNYIVIVSIILIIGGVIFYYFKSISKYSEEDLDTHEMGSFDFLIDSVSKSFAQTVRMDLKEMNLSREELMKEERKKEEHRKALKEAAYGNHSAKRFLIASIRNIITGPACKINENTIDEIISFNDINRLSARDKFEILLSVYSNLKGFGRNAFGAIIDEFQLDQPKKDKNGNVGYEITSSDIDRVYAYVMSDVDLTYDDKLRIVCQRIFSQYKGFGAVDVLIDSTLDEIDAGVNGVPKGAYDIKGINMRNLPFTYESIWVMYKGNNIHLSFLSFGSQEELVRVCQNICKHNAREVLSKRSGRIITTMMDGSRIVVVRPPLASSYAFFIRKFDSSPSSKPEELFSDPNNDIPITLMKWAVKGYRNIGITGSMGTGKTTGLKAFIRYIDKSCPIRLIETSNELNLQYTYPEYNIVNFQETDSVPIQDSLDLTKKTNAYINIIGEVATAEAASWMVQTANVGSRQSFFTHHAKTTKSLIYAIRDSLLAAGGYSSEKAAEEIVAEAINIDCHMENTKGHRYIAHINEVIPMYLRDYPQTNTKDMTEKQLQEATLKNENEYYKRVTDRELFTVRELCTYKDGKYVLLNLPSDKTINEIKKVLDDKQIEKFESDMKRISNISKKGDRD